MKKLLLIIAVVGIGATSCQKERTCKCKDTVSGKSISSKVKKGKIGDQKKACEKLSIGNFNCGLDLL